jgi:hypothetical protein
VTPFFALFVIFHRQAIITITAGYAYIYSSHLTDSFSFILHSNLQHAFNLEYIQRSLKTTHSRIQHYHHLRLDSTSRFFYQQEQLVSPLKLTFTASHLLFVLCVQLFLLTGAFSRTCWCILCKQGSVLTKQSYEADTITASTSVHTRNRYTQKLPFTFTLVLVASSSRTIKMPRVGLLLHVLESKLIFLTIAALIGKRMPARKSLHSFRPVPCDSVLHDLLPSGQPVHYQVAIRC